ncbi:MAG: [FeFe] hydrogenase, group A [Clostridia bacterium]|nr:[FeFe] hydrogenase, group A [Clostridia bacterium]
MVNIIINGQPVSVPEGTKIMEAAKTAGIEIPHLCYLKDINEISACRLCCVEVEGESKLVPACDNVVAEGMNITTNSPRVKSAVRTNLELILSQHHGHCVECARNGNCQLQTLANEYGIIGNSYPLDPVKEKFNEWPEDFPIIRDASKCVKCMRCIQICDKIQSLGIWNLYGAGSRAHIGVEAGKITASDCSICGQCVTHCPVGALRERNDIDKVRAAIADPNKTVVVQIAPAVRAAWGEEQGLTADEATVNKMAAALRQIGFDYVFDTCFTADLTIMEEGTELLERLKKGDLAKYPMFTSCCPGWVRFIKSQYPQLVKQLSTAKSPQQMFGAVIKGYFANKIEKDPKEIFSVSIMPCTAKKAEAALPTMAFTPGAQDVDVVLTTRELIRMVKAANIQIADMQESAFDSIMGEYTGAGVIFGTTGGVMEAALRTAAFVLTGSNPEPEAFATAPAVLDGVEMPWKEGKFNLNGAEVRIAVTSGLGNTRALCDAIVAEKVKYDFVEIMACPGGCAGGGGQTIHCDDVERAAERGESLRNIDRKMPLRFSHENKDVQALYADYLEKPLSEKSEAMLHTNHFGWAMPNETL